MTLTLVTVLALSATPVTPMDALLTNVPGGGQVSNAKVTELGSLRTTVRWTTSTSSEAALEQHFVNRFAKVGLSGAYAEKGTVGGIDATTHIAYGAQVFSDGPVRDVVVTSYEMTFELPAPLYPGATNVTSRRDETSFSAAASVASVERFYEAAMRSTGWSELHPMVFVKDDRLVTIDAVGDGEDTSVQVLSRTVAP